MSRAIKRSPRCDCGSSKPLLAPACDRCTRLGSIRKARHEGVRQRVDGFTDVKRACEAWLKARGIEAGDF